MRITIAKPNVYNAYGILLPQGSIQTVGIHPSPAGHLALGLLLGEAYAAQLNA